MRAPARHIVQWFWRRANASCCWRVIIPRRSVEARFVKLKGSSKRAGAQAGISSVWRHSRLVTGLWLAGRVKSNSSQADRSTRRFLPPDHLPVRRSADDRAPALNTVRRFNGYEFDTSRMDGEAVMERRLIKVAMYWAEIGEIGPATGQGIEAATC